MNEVSNHIQGERYHWGTWLSTGSPVIAEIASLHKFHWLLLDLEHGCCSESMLLQNLQAIKNNIKPIVRIGEFNPAIIARVLDWGAAGIMLPHTRSAKEAEVCLRSMHYPPKGNRGFSGSVRAFGYGTMGNVHPPAPLFMAQIETCEAVKNSKEIAAVPGVDVLFVGPVDLKMDIGINGEKEKIDFNSSLTMVCHAARVHKKQAGILVKTYEDALLYAGMGFTYIAYGSDINFVKEGFSQALNALGKLPALSL